MARRFKKVDGGHGHHGGAWKVAYADFVTAMMALFMVLWLLASTDAQSRKEISNYFRTGILPDGDLSMNRAAQAKPSVIEVSSVANPPEDSALDDKTKAAKDVSNKLMKMAQLDSELAQVIKSVRVTIKPDGVLIEAVDEGNGLLFDMSSAKLTEPLERFLRMMAPVLIGTGKPLEINGHTDARPFVGSKMSNWDLSYQRAEAAREIFEASGVPGSQIEGVFARGSSQLYVPDDPLDSKNRRLSIKIKIAKPADAPEKPAVEAGPTP